MKAGKIGGATRNLLAPEGWKESKHGVCEGLWVRDATYQTPLPEFTLPLVQSVWIPSDIDIAKIKAGQPILLSVIGHTHPPVSIQVGEFSDLEPTPTASVIPLKKA